MLIAETANGVQSFGGQPSKVMHYAVFLSDGKPSDHAADIVKPCAIDMRRVSKGNMIVRRTPWRSRWPRR